MSLRDDAAHGIVRPLRRVSRQEERRRAAVPLQRVENIGRIFIRCAVERQIHARRLAGRLFLDLRDGRFRRCLRGRAAGGAAAVLRGAVRGRNPLVAVDAVFDARRLGGGERGVARSRAVRHAENGFPRDRKRRVAQAELAAAQLDRNVGRAVHRVRRGGVAVEVLVVNVAFIGRKAERFAVCGHIQHPVRGGRGHAELRENAVRHVKLAAESGGHGAVRKRQQAVVHRRQRQRPRGRRNSAEKQSRAKESANRASPCLFHCSSPFLSSVDFIIANPRRFVTHLRGISSENEYLGNTVYSQKLYKYVPTVSMGIMRYCSCFIRTKCYNNG